MTAAPTAAARRAGRLTCTTAAAAASTAGASTDRMNDQPRDSSRHNKGSASGKLLFAEIHCYPSSQ
jgi:hypothetical protein